MVFQGRLTCVLVKIETIVLDPLGTAKVATASGMGYGTAIKYVQN